MKYRNHIMLLLIVIGFATLISNIEFSSSYSHGPNYENVTIDTTVNITNAQPEIITVVIQGGSSPITLNAGRNKTIYCNVTIRDYNGGDDITGVNATFYHILNTSDTADDRNWHYSNLTCTNGTPYGTGNYYVDYLCNFTVDYYAANGTWYCNATVIDDYNFTDNESNTTVISALYALNVTPSIDYGDLAVEDTSINKTANITNYGNMAINISLYGYGVTAGDGLAMNCTVGNITVEHEKFSISVSDDYAAKTALVGTPASPVLLGLTSPWRRDDSTPVTNTTYWQLYISPNPFGICNGSIVFSAETP